MATPPASEIAEISASYAQSLYAYASARLGAYSLRCWIIRRVMLDLGVSHAAAERAFAAVQATARAADLERWSPPTRLRSTGPRVRLPRARPSARRACR